MNEVPSSELLGVVLLRMRKSLCRADGIHLNQAGASLYYKSSHPPVGLLYVDLRI